MHMSGIGSGGALICHPLSRALSCSISPYLACIRDLIFLFLDSFFILSFEKPIPIDYHGPISLDSPEYLRSNVSFASLAMGLLGEDWVN